MTIPEILDDLRHRADVADGLGEDSIVHNTAIASLLRQAADKIQAEHNRQLDESGKELDNIKALTNKLANANAKLCRENEALHVKIACYANYVGLQLNLDLRDCADCQLRRFKMIQPETPPAIGTDAKCDGCCRAAQIRTAWRITK